MVISARPPMADPIIRPVLAGDVFDTPVTELDEDSDGKVVEEASKEDDVEIVKDCEVMFDVDDVSVLDEDVLVVDEEVVLVALDEVVTAPGGNVSVGGSGSSTM